MVAIAGMIWHQADMDADVNQPEPGTNLHVGPMSYKWGYTIQFLQDISVCV
jgi:hypothetical protein